MPHKRGKRPHQPSHPDPLPERPRRPSRLRAAWWVLFGKRLVPEQIQAEWQEYQLIFNDLLQRQSALLARSAKAEKERLKSLAQESEQPAAQLSLLPSGSSKAALRSVAAERLGLGPLRARLPSSQPHQVEESAG